MMKYIKRVVALGLILCSACGYADTIRVAGWPMSNSSAVTDPSKRSALYAALGDQDVDFVYICNGKATDEYSCETYGFVKCQTALQSVSYGQMVLGYDNSKYTLLASTDTTRTGGQAYLYSNAILTQGLYLENNTTKERFFFMAFAGQNADFSKSAYKNWFSWVMSDIAANYPCEKIVLIFAISKSKANFETYLTGTAGLSELCYDNEVTDFALFASPGQFTLSSAQSVTVSSVSTGAEGLFEVSHTPKCTVTFVDYDGTVLKSQSVVSGGSVTPPSDPVREGFEFTGWDHVDSDFENVTTGFTVVAQYAASGNSHSVRFLDEDGSTVLGEFAVEDGTAATPPSPMPEHEGEHFVCWMLGDEEYDISTPVTSDLVLVALYAANVYEVTFLDWNGGRLGEVQQVQHGFPAFAPELPTLPQGKLFWKWDNDFSEVAGDMTVTALIVDAEREIGTFEQFMAAITEDAPSGAVYRLTADINLAAWNAVDFAGALDGCGHKVEGLGAPLFNTISGGRVQNLTVSASTVVSSANGESIGFVARRLECGASVSNCTVNADCLMRAGNNVQCGAIVGKIEKGAGYAGVDFSGIFDCTNHAVIEKTTVDANTTAGGCGGIVGHVTVSLPTGLPTAICRIERCFNDGAILSTVAACNLGGIAGYATISGNTELLFVECQNVGAISNTSTGASSSYVTTHAGGIVGYIGGPFTGLISISRCANRGMVMSGYEPEYSEHIRKCAGGIVAKVESLAKQSTLSVVDSANYGAVSGNSAAGLIAQIGANVNYSGTTVVLSNVANYAAVSGVTNVAQAIGRVTVPAVAHARRIVNAFFSTSANAGVPLFGNESTADDFVVESVIESDVTREGYSASADRNALNAKAAETGLGPWVLGRIGDGNASFVAPELECFMTRAGAIGLSIIIM